MKFEYGAMSSRYEIEADDKLTAYAAMIAHFDRSAHLIALYEPKEIINDDQWIDVFGNISERLDEIYGGEGSFDKYVIEHIDDIKVAYGTIKQLV